MASGLAENPAGHLGQIYSFDLFLTEGYDWFFEASQLPAFGSVFPLFARITEDYRDRIVPIPGDLLKMQWNTDPIEILFVDVAKSAYFGCRAAELRPLLRMVDSSSNGVLRRYPLSLLSTIGCGLFGISRFSMCFSHFFERSVRGYLKASPFPSN
jgi:hypothetical protein